MIKKNIIFCPIENFTGDFGHQILNLATILCRLIEPTVLVDPPLKAGIMTEEIFGPLLPIITVSYTYSLVFSYSLNWHLFLKFFFKKNQMRLP